MGARDGGRGHRAQHAAHGEEPACAEQVREIEQRAHQRAGNEAALHGHGQPCGLPRRQPELGNQRRRDGGGREPERHAEELARGQQGEHDPGPSRAGYGSIGFETHDELGSGGPNIISDLAGQRQTKPGARDTGPSDVVALNGLAMDIPYTKRTLANGLPVLIHEDHRCPIVAVNLWYHVGSKDEQPGRTGFAHLFEHLMFEGSAHYDHGFFQPLQQAGAVLNGSTNSDRTNYWEVVPTAALELALWMESDRMGHLLPALTEDKFRNQRDVVLNERRQNYENRPYGMAGMVIVDELFPPDHPYHWLTIGSPDDLRAASLDDVRAFFTRHYHPANASLALAGDVDPAVVLPMVEAYFGAIDPGPLAEAVPHDETGVRSARLVMEDAVELPRLYLTWVSPAMFDPGDADLDLVADILGDGKSSRTYRTMVYERRIATDVMAMQHSRELCSLFQVVATAAPGHGLAELESAIDAEVSKFAESGPSEAEMRRSLSQAEAQFIYRVQTVGGFGGKSDQLNQYNVMLGDPGYLGQDLERYRAATPASVTRAARDVLHAVPRVALSVVPRGRLDLALPDSRKVVRS